MESKRIIWTTVTLVVLLCSAIGSAEETRGKVQMFETLPAIQDADPDRRHFVSVLMPSELLIEFTDGEAHVSFDSTSAYEVRISAGYKMAIGCEWILYYFDGAERIEVRRNLGGSLETLFDAGFMVVRGLGKTLDSQGSLQLIAELTVFETDIPAQHAWVPKDGRYRPLWRGVASGVLGGGQ